MLLRSITLLAVTGVLATAPSASAEPAQVVLSCTSLGGLPGGPPERAGVGTVSKDGDVVATFTVPGPCAAPGFPLNR